MKTKIWWCKIGEAEESWLPQGADFPMRQAVEAAYTQLTAEAT